MDFVKIYKAANLSEAHILEGLLQSKCIEVKFLGESLSVGAGELPMEVLQIDMYVKLRNQKNAKAVIVEYEKNIKKEYIKSWICGKCKKINPGNFEICWKCNS